MISHQYVHMLFCQKSLMIPYDHTFMIIFSFGYTYIYGYTCQDSN